MAVNFFSDSTFNCDNFRITSGSTGKPEVFITTTGNNNKPSILTFTKDKGAAGADNDGIGAFSFVSDNDAQQQTTFGTILYSVESATDGQEEGKINIGVAALNSGGNNSANVLEGVGNGQNVTDVTIGLGATNVTTIAGTLTMGSTATLDNSGNLLTNAATATNLVASTSTAVQLGTVELGHASDTTIARSEAGKVTIEGAPIQTTQIVTSHHNMSLDGSSSTVDYYFPINSLADGSGSSFYYTRVLPAYDGKVVKILFRGSNNMGSSCTIYMSRRAHDGTSVSHQTSGFQASETFNGATKTTVIVPCGVGGSNAADWVFEEGDQLGFSLVKNTTATNVDLVVTIVYEYTIS